MKTSFKSIIKASVLAAVTSLFVVACGDKEQEITPTPTGPTTVAVTGVSLSKSSLTLTEGGSETIAASVTPSNATNQAVSWSSSNTGVATVDGGKVTAVKAGSATITVTTSDGGKTAKCEVTVEAKVIPVSGITVDKETLSIVEGEDATLTATVAPEDASDKTFAWSTSDEKVATVDENGKVTAVAAGTATITATTTDGGKTAKCEVTVEAKVIPVEGVTVDKETLEMVEGEEATLAATVAPEEATDKSVTWTSSDEAVATVDAEGKVTAVAPGTATITVTTTDGEKTAKCEVTVSAKVIPVESVTLDKETLEMVEGDEASIAATVAPEEATDKTVKWTSSDETVATVDAEGKVTAVKAGTATITATTNDGGKTATCAVTVEAKVIPVEAIEFAEATISVIEGQAGKVSVVFKPETPTNTNVTFESADPAVATVDAEGNVTGVAPGATTITVTTEDGGMTATCDVTVEPKPIPVSKVEINRTAINLIVESSAILVATVSPEDATNKNVVWSSSDESIVKVDQKGEVTALKVGKATVTVTTEDGGKTFDCEVTVSDKPIQVTGVSIYPTSRTINVGYSYQLTANITPADATNHEVKWTSSNTSVATVDETGKVTAIKPGTATITVKTANNGKTATCKITVPENYTVRYNGSNIGEGSTLSTTVSLDGTGILLMPYDLTKNTEIRPTSLPSGYSSSNTSVARVEVAFLGASSAASGVYCAWRIVPLKAGSCTIKLVYGTMTRTFTLKVSEPTIKLVYAGSVSSINANSTVVNDRMTLSKGYSYYMRLYDVTNKRMLTGNYYSVTSSKSSIATTSTASSSGEYYVLLKAGTAVGSSDGVSRITLKYGSYTKSFDAIIPTYLSVSMSGDEYVNPSNSTLGVKVGNELRFYLWNTSENRKWGANKDYFTVTSSNTSVATATPASSDYVSVKGIKDGTATITIKYDNGKGATANWSGTVTVAGSYNVYWLRKRQSTNTEILLPPNGTTGEETLVERSSSSDTRIYPCKNSKDLASIITNTSIYTSRYSYTYTNSNSSVVDVEAKSDGTNQWFELRGKSDGTANVTFKYEDKLAGLSSTYSIKVRVRAKNNNINLVADWSYTSIAGQAISSCAVGQWKYWYTADSSTGTLIPYKTKYLTVTSQGDSSIALTGINSEPNNQYGYYVCSLGKKAGTVHPTILFDNGIERKTYTLNFQVNSQ